MTLATTIAQHASTCDLCRDPIYEGDVIAFDETAQSWVHEECAEDQADN